MIEEIIVDGVRRPMTPEEVKRYAAEREELKKHFPLPTPSLEERVAQTESNVASLQSEMDDIGYIFTGKEHE